MGAKNFLPRFNATGGTNPDIGSNTLTIHGEGSYGQGQNLTARWGTIFANQGNFTGNLSIGQSELSGGATSTTNQITFGDDFYIGQNNSDNTLSIGTGTNVSTNTVLTLTSEGIQSSNITASASLNAPTFFPTSGGFVQYKNPSDNEIETTLVFVTPSADRIIVFPDASGTLAFTSDITGFVDTSGSPVDDDFAKFTDSNTIEGRSIAETKSDLSLDNVENKSSATIRGEIVSGDIPNNAADTSGQAGTVATIAGLAPDTATTQATQPNITTMTGFVTGSANQLITDDGDGTVTSESNLTFDGDDFNVTSSSASRPKLTITNTNISSKGPNILLVNDKGAAGALNDEAGTITFKSDNASQSLISYGSIAAKAIGVIAGDESGTLVLSTASSDGSSSNLRNVITGVGSVSADTVTVDIGYGTGSNTTIAGTLRIDGDSLITAGNLTFTPGGTLELDSTGDMTLDSSANIELNADGGDIDFKDGSAQLAKISSAGLSFVDNTGAGIIFEGDTDDAYQTTLTAADTTSSDKTITLPDATGTVQLQGENTGHVIHVNIRDNGSYLFYLFNDDSWYSAGSTTLAILGSSTAPSDISSANSEYQGRVGCYTAIADCTVKKLIFTFYWSSSVVNSADIDFAFSKFTPITDGTAASITMNAITATDCNGSYTEVKPYQKTFTFSGGNASLSAGDSFAFHMRTTGGSSSQRILVYGNAVLSLELD